MKSRIKNIEECLKLFKIEIPHEAVKRAVEEVYREIKKVAKIPGFRAGNVPQDLLEKHYSKNAEEEALKRLVPDGYRKALETHRVIPVGMPHISNINFAVDRPLTFEAQVETKPNIKLKGYKGIRVTKKRISISREEKDEALSKLRHIYAEHNEVERPLQKGDYAVCDIEAFADGAPISKKNENMWVLVDKEASLLGMGEKLLGLTKGQAKEIEAKLPDNYPDKKYAGKLAKFKILVNAVREKRLPEPDDAFAKKVNAKNLEALKAEIESQLFARKEKSLTINMQNQILDKLLKNSRFSVPPGLVKRQKEVLRKRLEEELLEKGIRSDEARKKVDEFDAKLAEDARNRVRIYFILDDIAFKEKIEAAEADITERLQAIAASTGRSPEEVKKYYEEKDLLGGLAEEIKEAKTLGFLLKSADVIEEK
jgi:trigger factor